MTRYKGRQKRNVLTAGRLRKLLNYAPATGVFRRRMHTGRNKVGTVAGTIHPPKGYRQICIDGKIYRANRLAWLYMTGKWPKLEIGYINHKTSDTRWANLRAMTPSQRGATSRTRNKLGVRGVWITKSGKYGGWRKKVSRIIRHDREGQRGLHQSSQRRLRAIRKCAVTCSKGKEQF